MERFGEPGRIYEWHPAADATDMLDGGRKRVDTLRDEDARLEGGGLA